MHAVLDNECQGGVEEAAEEGADDADGVVVCGYFRGRVVAVGRGGLMFYVASLRAYSDVFLTADVVRSVATPNASKMIRDMSSRRGPMDRISGT